MSLNEKENLMFYNPRTVENVKKLGYREGVIEREQSRGLILTKC